MRITSVTQALNAELKKVENAKKSDAVSRGAATSDSSVISAKGQRLSATSSNSEVVLNHIANVPDIREEKVEEVRLKIQSGYYNTPEFIDKLAEKLTKDFGFND